MKARITYRDAELGTATATLGDDFVWTADDPRLEQTLAALLEVTDKSPAAGYWVRPHVEEMATWMNGTIEWGPPEPPDPPGVKY